MQNFISTASLYAGELRTCVLSAFQKMVGVGLPTTTHLTMTLCPRDTVLSRGVIAKLGRAEYADEPTDIQTDAQADTGTQ